MAHIVSSLFISGFLMLSSNPSSIPQQTPLAPSSNPAMTTISVREVTLRDGASRFTIPVRIGATTVEAGLDTGSVGLRVMARALKPSDTQTRGTPAYYAYGSGVRLVGVQAQAQVSIGQASGSIAIQVVSGVECLPKKPKCPASRMPFNKYGIMGDGIPGQGFEAIIGIKTNDDATIPNPLLAIGAPRWTLVLPGGRLGGALVLNPDTQSLSGFMKLPVATGPGTRLHDAVRGCIQNDATQQQVCGFVEMDTGAPGISVSSAQPLPSGWNGNASTSLLLQDSGGQTKAMENLRVQDRANRFRVHFDQKPDAQYTVIHAGGLPLLCFEVLFDDEAGTLGFKPRPTGAQLPHCALQ